MDKATISAMGSNRKITSMTINLPEITSTNFDATAGNLTALKDALDAVCTPSVFRIAKNSSTAPLQPSAAAGVAGNKAVIKWYSALENDGDGAYGSNEMGCADPTAFTLVGGKLILQGTAYDDLKEAFDDVAVTENGHPVSVYEVEFVTRTL